MITSDNTGKTKRLIERLNSDRYGRDAKPIPTSIKFLVDRKGQIKKLFSVEAIPATFIIDRSGIVLEFMLGYPVEKTPVYETYVRERIEKLL